MKIRALFLTLLLSLCLTACMKDEATKKAESDIAAMGEITLESGDSIKAVEDYYNSLTDKQKSKVENAQVLTEARNRFNALQEEEKKRIEDLVSEGVKLIRTNDVTNHEKALACFEEADKAGNLDGSFMAGYTLDWVLKEKAGQDYEKARGYYEKSPDNPYAKICLAFLYENGQGVEADEEKAKEYMKAAYDELMPDKLTEAESKIYNAEALMLNGWLFCSDILGEESVDYAKAKEWYEKAAELGNVTAIENIGLMYEDGKGVEQDYAKAMEWYMKASDAGSAESMRRIAMMYCDGLGVEQNYYITLEWFEKSAVAGNAESMYTLGMAYYNGTVVSVDTVKAMEWFEKAAEQGHPGAARSIGYGYLKGIGVEKNSTKAVEWYEKAVDLGLAEAAGDLCLAYLEGQGVEKNFEKAKEWYEKAVELGGENARAYLSAYF